MLQAFKKTEQEEKARLDLLNRQMPDELKIDPALAICRLSFLGSLRPNGLNALAAVLGISPQQVDELREKVGVTQAGKGEREKRELGLGLGFDQEGLRLLTYVDLMAYGRFKVLFEHDFKGKSKELDEDTVIRRHAEAKYDINYVSKMSPLGIEHLSTLMEIDKDGLEWPIGLSH